MKRLQLVWTWWPGDWRWGRLPGGGGVSLVYRWGVYIGPLWVGRWVEYP